MDNKNELKLSEYLQILLSNLDKIDHTSAVYNTNKHQNVSPTPFNKIYNLNEIIDDYFTYIYSSGINTSSGKFMGYIPGGGLPIAALADFLAAITNPYSGLKNANLGAELIEEEVISWMCSLFFPSGNPWGSLTSGGTHANLTALFASRKSKNVPTGKRRIYIGEYAHHSIQSALDIIGILDEEIKIIPNKNGILDTTNLEQSIIQDKKDKRIPLCVIATAGATTTGAIDDFSSIANICEKHDIWLHVDAAYGGFFTLTEEIRNKYYKEIERADSITVDPHKSLFLPYGIGAVLVKNKLSLQKVTNQNASYMSRNDELLSQCDYSIELTRHFRALRLWFCLKFYGVDFFKQQLNEKLQLSQMLRAKIQNLKDINLNPTDNLTVINFNFKNDELKTREILDKINTSNKAYISSNRINGFLFARICILSFRSGKEEVERLFTIIKDSIQ